MRDLAIRSRELDPHRRRAHPSGQGPEQAERQEQKQERPPRERLARRFPPRPPPRRLRHGGRIPSMEGGHGAGVYDAVYRWKDYDAEAVALERILAAKAGGTLLDVACGTGSHLVRLRGAFLAEGLERDPEMAAVARAKGLVVHEGDMERFDLGRRFDAVTCLFSSIGYMETPARLARAICRMAAHLAPGGRLVVEPFFEPHVWRDGQVNADFVDDADLKIARVSVSRSDGPVAVMAIAPSRRDPGRRLVLRHRASPGAVRPLGDGGGVRRRGAVGAVRPGGLDGTRTVRRFPPLEILRQGLALEHLLPRLASLHRGRTRRPRAGARRRDGGSGCSCSPWRRCTRRWRAPGGGRRARDRREARRRGTGGRSRSACR